MNRLFLPKMIKINCLVNGIWRYDVTLLSLRLATCQSQTLNASRHRGAYSQMAAQMFSEKLSLKQQRAGLFTQAHFDPGYFGVRSLSGVREPKARRETYLRNWGEKRAKSTIFRALERNECYDHRPRGGSLPDVIKSLGLLENFMVLKD